MTGRGSGLDRAVERVVASGNCSGCGLCTLLDSGLQMRTSDDGYNRPTRVGPENSVPDAVRRFDAACPGVRVAAQAPAGSHRHPTMGPIIQVWSAWASDPQIRHAGSSGGTLTALATWLSDTGEASRIVGARAARDDPRRTVSVTITTRENALASAGSRYAPASNCAVAGAPGQGAFIGKPCEVSALRADTAATGSPLLLSFYCAGTPSQHATNALAERLGVGPDEPIRDLWYRGRGWPGSFTVERPDGTTVATSYEQSWGEHLGRAVQWRCKICPDGVGESSDITAADLWQADERGFPDFTEGAGVSALIARTERGLDVITRAIAAGILVATPIQINDLAAVQPYQRQRRQTLLGRLAGTVAAGGVIPRFSGFGLARLALPRLRESLRVARGTYRRRRAWAKRQ